MDNCIIKENNYREEILQEGRLSKYKLLDEIYNPIRNTQYQEIKQAVIIYNYIDETTNIRIVSRIFNFDANTLRLYIKMGRITLYIDKFNRNQYMFTLKL